MGKIGVQIESCFKYLLLVKSVRPDVGIEKQPKMKPMKGMFFKIATKVAKF